MEYIDSIESHDYQREVQLVQAATAEESSQYSQFQDEIIKSPFIQQIKRNAAIGKKVQRDNDYKCLIIKEGTVGKNMTEYSLCYRQ